MWWLFWVTFATAITINQLPLIMNIWFENNYGMENFIWFYGLSMILFGFSIGVAITIIYLAWKYAQQNSTKVKP